MSMVEAITGWMWRSPSRMGSVFGASDSKQLSAPAEPAGPSYQLRCWPTLPRSLKTADVFRLLSRMTVQPVTRNWMETHAGVAPHRLLALLERLRAQDALEVTGRPGL